MIEKNVFLQASKYCVLAISLVNLMFAQSSPLDYFPHHAGDKWQYRNAFNEITFRRFIDSVSTDSNRNTIVWARTGDAQLYPQQFKIDSLFNVYNLNFQSKYVRYKLNADSGQSWIGGVQYSDTAVITMIYNASGYVFGKLVKIKVFEFVSRRKDGFKTWLGRDYLAEGFGLVRMDVEPSEIYWLRGAIINQTHYGEPILKVEENVLQKNQFILSQNYPNPFNPITTISYGIPEAGTVHLVVYDNLGREVATLVNEYKNAGRYEVQFDAGKFASGIYFYKLQADKFNEVKKMQMVK